MAITELTITDKEQILLDEAKKLFPDATSDVEAVDLYSQKVRKEALLTTKEETELFQELSFRYARLDRVYRKLVAQMELEG